MVELRKWMTLVVIALLGASFVYDIEDFLVFLKEKETLQLKIDLARYNSEMKYWNEYLKEAERRKDDT